MSPDLHVPALFQAPDDRRRERGLSWREVADECTRPSTRNGVGGA